MRSFLLFVTLIFTFAAASQNITTIDYVKTKPGEQTDYIQFLEKNWIVAREKAKEKGFILSYKYEITNTDTLADIRLITVYRDKLAFDDRENIFKQIFKEYFPNGAILINGKRSRDMADIKLSKEMSGKQ